MQLPGFANWPIFKQILSVMFSVMTFIYEVLETIGAVNVGVAVIVFALFIQLCLIPFKIRTGIKREKRIKKNAKIALIKEEYKGRMDDETAVAEMKERQQKVKEEYKEPKGVGCLFTIIQIIFLVLSFTAVTYAETYVPVLMNASEEGLMAAYSFLGMNLKQSAQESLWPNGLFALCYLLLHFVPGIVKQRIAKKKEKKMIMEGMTEEEKQEYLKSTKFNLKNGGFEVFQFVLKLWWPLMYGGISFTISSMLLIYWISGHFIGLAIDKGAQKICKYFEKRKERPVLEDGVVENVQYTEVKVDVDASTAQ